MIVEPLRIARGDGTALDLIDGGGHGGALAVTEPAGLRSIALLETSELDAIHSWLAERALEHARAAALAAPRRPPARGLLPRSIALLWATSDVVRDAGEGLERLADGIGTAGYQLSHLTGWLGERLGR